MGRDEAPLHILLLSDRFYPEVAAPSVRGLDHARAWVKAGHRVTVVTGAPNHPRGVVFPGYRNAPWTVEELDGIRIVRVWSYVSANSGRVRRSLDHVSLAAVGAAWWWRYEDFDVVLATSPPLLTAVQGVLVAKWRRRPWVFEVRDLWPASIRAVGLGGDGVLYKILEQLELSLYRNADGIVVVTEAFREDLVARGVDPERIAVVRNGVDTVAFSRESVGGDAREALGVPRDTFLIGYLGTIGMAHGLERVLDAAELDASLSWLFMGDGAEAEALKAEAARRGLANVRFLPPVPHAEVARTTLALDASLVHLRPAPLFQTVIPSKIFESMALGVPMIAAIDGEGARLVTESGAGLVVPQGDPMALVEAARRLRGDAKLRRRLSKAGPMAARAFHDRSHTAARMIDALQAAVSRFRSSP